MSSFVNLCDGSKNLLAARGETYSIQRHLLRETFLADDARTGRHPHSPARLLKLRNWHEAVDGLTTQRVRKRRTLGFRGAVTRFLFGRDRRAASKSNAAPYMTME
ncbi:hypothetical protein [Bradyrhizobium sp. WSM1743]|uniref:hypothetical protein n=1 Tax=Bradyrhizobium sp. WSM1743 TaxID=318996 RepID=UPI0012EBACC3|nr:hypothetical protein [Bradyrhizobium sp. WSM1743]